jgi:hypothetical protein
MAHHNDSNPDSNPINSSVARRKLAVWLLPALVLSLALLAPGPSAIRAADHADPLVVSDHPETNITDMFFFPKGDQMILIFNIRRALTNPKPYHLDPFEYKVHMDLTTPVTFDKPDDRARYGGTVSKPEALHDDVTITIHLNDDTTLKDKTFKGLKDPDRIRIFTGVRDDPFIFPRFFKKNIITMVMSIPLSSFPDGQRDWILWSSTYKDGKQTDHHGRSNRTQQGRFSALNELPPNEHVAQIMKDMKTWDDRFKFINGFNETMPKELANVIQILVQIRKYDLAPDVMIYTNRFPPGFPNGRFLTDDVAAITCSTGDCILQELSFIEGGWPRATANDKPFLDDWPFLAEPWPDMPETPPSTQSIWMYIIPIVILNLIVSWALVEFLVVRWFRRRPKAAAA